MRYDTLKNDTARNQKKVMSYFARNQKKTNEIFQKKMQNLRTDRQIDVETAEQTDNSDFICPSTVWRSNIQYRLL